MEEALDYRLQILLANLHSEQIIAGNFPVDYRGINLLGEDEITISPRLTACLYCSLEPECKEGIDMLWTTQGEAGTDFIKCELGLVPRLKVPYERIQEESGAELVRLPDLLKGSNEVLLEAREQLREQRIPLAVLLVGRSLPELEVATFLFHLPFMESQPLVEKVQERISAYLG